MKDLKNIITNITAIVIVVAAAIAYAINTGTITFLPEWVAQLCILIGVIGGAVGISTGGLNANLTKKSKAQLKQQAMDQQKQR